MSIDALVEQLERNGVTLIPLGDQLKLRAPADRVPKPEVIEILRQQKAALLAYLRTRSGEGPPAKAIPPRAILYAARYNGGSTPLAEIPACWCCQTPYQLERLQERGGKSYAHLGPGCSCLDVPQRIACCGLCWEHCLCPRGRIGGWGRGASAESRPLRGSTGQF